jgi:hypothetical protein
VFLADVNGLINRLGGDLPPALPATTTTLATAPNPANFAATVTLTATVSAGGGTVTFYDGATDIPPPVTVSAGTAVKTTSSLSVGHHNLSASYSGDATHGSSSSNIVDQLINAFSSTTAIVLTSGTQPSTFGDPLVFTATITTTGTPTGTVTFFDGATDISGPRTVSGGTATSGTITSLGVGAHSITAVYSGDAGHASSTSPPLTQTVNAPADTTKPSATISLHAGQADPTSTSPIVFDVLFDETVTGFVSADVSTTGSTVGGTLVAVVAGSGASYTISVTGMAAPDGNVVVNFAAGAASDLAGNTSNAPTIVDNTVAWTSGAAPFPDNTTSANEYLILFV